MSDWGRNGIRIVDWADQRARAVLAAIGLDRNEDCIELVAAALRGAREETVRELQRAPNLSEQQMRGATCSHQDPRGILCPGCVHAMALRLRHAEEEIGKLRSARDYLGQTIADAVRLLAKGMP